MRKAVVWVIVLVFGLGMAIGFYINKPQAVQACTASLHEFTTFIEGAGTIGAPTQQVFTPSDGLIKHIFVKQGQRVNAGDIVLQMDDEGLRLQLEEAILALNAQKKAWSKQNDELSRSSREAAMTAAQATGYGLAEFNSAVQAPDEQIIGSEQVDIARLKVRLANELIDNTAVHSTISGTVLDVTARDGDLAPAGTPAAIIASLDEVEIESVFADLDAASIEPGMEVQLYGGCLGGATCGGVVTETAPMAKAQQSQTGPKSVAVVKIRPADTGLFRRLGASVELKVVTGRKTALGVPIEALAQDSSGLFVYVLRGGRAYRTPVEVGVLDEAFAEVKSGVSEGDTVALNPTDLRNGERVSGT